MLVMYSLQQSIENIYTTYQVVSILENLNIKYDKIKLMKEFENYRSEYGDYVLIIDDILLLYTLQKDTFRLHSIS